MFSSKQQPEIIGISWVASKMIRAKCFLNDEIRILRFDLPLSPPSAETTSPCSIPSLLVRFFEQDDNFGVPVRIHQYADHEGNYSPWNRIR